MPAKWERLISGHPIEHQRAVVGGFLGVAVARHALETLRAREGNPLAVLRELGLNQQIFADPRDLVSLRTIGRILTHCAERAARPHFGLLVGASLGAAAFDELDACLSSAASLPAALGLFAGQRYTGSGAMFSYEVDGNDVDLTFLAYDPGMVGIGLTSELMLAAVVGAIRHLLDADWRPSEVLIPRRLPPDPSPYREYFRAPVRFDQETATILLSSAAIGAPLSEAPSAKAKSAEPVVDRIRRYLRRAMLDRCPDSREVADAFDMHPRTLNRRLKAEGTTLRQLIDQIRFAIAHQLVMETDIPLVQVSAAVHFSEPAAFTRAFERWSGAAPSTWRAVSRGQGAT